MPKKKTKMSNRYLKPDVALLLEDVGEMKHLAVDMVGGETPPEEMVERRERVGEWFDAVQAFFEEESSHEGD